MFFKLDGAKTLETPWVWDSLRAEQAQNIDKRSGFKVRRRKNATNALSAALGGRENGTIETAAGDSGLHFSTFSARLSNRSRS